MRALAEICNHPLATWFRAQGSIIRGANRQAESSANVGHERPPFERKLILDFARLPVGISHGISLLALPTLGELVARLYVDLILCVYTAMGFNLTPVMVKKGSYVYLGVSLDIYRYGFVIVRKIWV